MADSAGGGSRSDQRRLSTVERAFELARSGAFNNASDIAVALKREHFESVDSHLAGSSIRRSLRKDCDTARLERRTPPAD
jgi:hypothetical protein